MRCSPRVLAAGLLAVALALTPGDAGAKKRDKKGPRPKLTLRANVQAGFTPLTIQFTARLRNVDAGDESYCHAGSFLMLGTYDSYRIVRGEDPACLHPPEETSVHLTFSHTFTVTRAGRYEFLAMVRTVDGTEIVSNGVPVRVVASPGGR